MPFSSELDGIPGRARRKVASRCTLSYTPTRGPCDVQFISAATNDFDMPLETIVAIYRRRWQIESLFKQVKQNFPLRYFYGESANAIKIQIWVTLIANLLLSVLQNTLQRRWSFSGLATMVRIVMMYYLNLEYSRCANSSVYQFACRIKTVQRFS